MVKPSILIVEDEPSQREILCYNLAAEGYEVLIAENGEEALLVVDEASPDIILLDWMMPLVSGIEVCRRLKLNRETREIPIIMLSARSEEVDKVRGLETGADDYLTKPFSPRELLARVAAVMRRIRPALAGEVVEVGDIKLDAVSFKVERRGQSLQLGPTEYRLLKFFMESPGRVFSRGQLLDGVWGTDSDIELRTVDVHIRRLRKAIGIDGAKDPIRTVRSAGYALEAV